ncbi:esterase-like activity of phytase-domain-containing protein [Infundibulicybe gibba]|nr:esterase-like activity of phytase-domain-containing protein [Infundibulicybe gibba]
MGRSTSSLCWALCILSITLGVQPTPTLSPPGKRASAASVSAVLNGVTYVNKGLVGFGLIPSNFRESTGDTLGGIGSAIAVKPGTWTSSSGAYSGTLLVHPDRGFNVDGTIDYQARQHEIDFVLHPYTGSANLDFASAQQTLQLTYRETMMLWDVNGTKTTGFDALAIRASQSGSSLVPYPQLPIASTAEPHLALDIEGLVVNADGSFWISDEYGPYIYKYSADGNLLQAIQPPTAITPHDSHGALNFTSAVDPATGRSANQGFEGLTVDATNHILYAMLQSATIQDGGDDKSTSRYTRLLAYDISNSAAPASLVGEWVVPLPLSSKGKTLQTSEIHFVSPGVFLALARDSDGHGGDDNNSGYKQADLFSISGATDIHGSKFDLPANPLAPGGKLDKSITPATYVGFASYIDATQLARFGLHNGKPSDATLINAKWESFALASVGDSAFPDDYFLFTASDNDFMTTDGVALGVPYNAGIDIDNQFLVFRLTLPGVTKGSF